MNKVVKYKIEYDSSIDLINESWNTFEKYEYIQLTIDTKSNTIVAVNSLLVTSTNITITDQNGKLLGFYDDDGNYIGK